jgi:hypothetical protein
MRVPGHLFVARHTSSPLNIGITDSGSVLFASTNAAVAKAAAVLGSTKIEIDQIKEGVMCEFWIDDDGKLASNVQEFKPPKTFHTQAGAWEYDEGAWFPRGRTTYGGTTTVQRATASASPGTTGAYAVGAEGWVLRKGDEVVFQPNVAGYDPMFGSIVHFGARADMAYVEFELDAGLEEEIALPVRQLWPAGAWRATLTAVADPAAVAALPPVKVENTLTSEDDYYLPRSTEDLVTAIEEIFGVEALDLIPGFHEWERGELPSWIIPDENDDVIDVEEVSSDG